MNDSIADQAAAAIRAYVISRGLTPGQRLPSERVLAESLGTSRPALREAIRRLEAERVVDVRGRSGTYIAAIDVEELFAVRLQLEPLAARLTAEHRSSAELQELHSMVRDLRRAVARPVDFSAVDGRLHAAIARFSGNTVLAQLILQLSDLTLISRGTTVHDDETRAGTITDMAELVDAVDAHDGESAASAMQAHLQRIRSTAVGEAFLSALPSPLPARH